VYGSLRILADLRGEGVRISRKTVTASMRRQRLAGISSRRFTPVTTVVDLDAYRPEELVDRRFDRGVLDNESRNARADRCRRVQPSSTVDRRVSRLVVRR
jgi:hypothetical protein